MQETRCCNISSGGSWMNYVWPNVILQMAVRIAGAKYTDNYYGSFIEGQPTDGLTSGRSYFYHILIWSIAVANLLYA